MRKFSDAITTVFKHLISFINIFSQFILYPDVKECLPIITMNSKEIGENSIALILLFNFDNDIKMFL